MSLPREIRPFYNLKLEGEHKGSKYVALPIIFLPIPPINIAVP